MKQIWVIQAAGYETDPEALATTEEIARHVADTLGLDGNLWTLTLFEEGDKLPEKDFRYCLWMNPDGSIQERPSGFLDCTTVDGVPPQPWVGWNLSGMICAQYYPSREAAEAAARAMLEQGPPEA